MRGGKKEKLGRERKIASKPEKKLRESKKEGRKKRGKEKREE